MFDVTYDHLRSALGCSDNSLTTYTKGLPRRRSGCRKGSQPFRYRLDEIIVALRQRRRGGLHGEDLHALMDAIPLTWDLRKSLGADSVERGHRLRSVFTNSENIVLTHIQTSFLRGCTTAFFDKICHVSTGMCILLPVVPNVLHYVLNGDGSGLPFSTSGWGKFSSQLVLGNSDAQTIAKLAGTTAA